MDAAEQNSWLITALLFILFSFLGWLMETTLLSIQTKKWVNRGFMVGPFCPIYGVGVSAVYLFLSPFSQNIFILFVAGVLFTSVLEYFTSWLMELLFHARWWDYSHHKINLNGRISLSISLCWGMLSVIVVRYILPVISDFMTNLWDEQTSERIIAVYAIYFVLDFCFSAYNAFGLSKVLKDLSQIRRELQKTLANIKLDDILGGVKDKRDEWNKRIENITNAFIKNNVPQSVQDAVGGLHSKLKDLGETYNSRMQKNNYFHKRLLKAFPKMKATTQSRVRRDEKESYNTAIQDLKARIISQAKKNKRS